MDARQYNSCVSQLKKQCEKLIDGGFHCAVVFSTSNGLLLTHGSQVIREHIGVVGDEILDDPRWQEQGADIEVSTVGYKANIRLLEKPIATMSLMDLRTTIPQLLRVERGRQNIGWGNEERRPVWWPQDVPFVNVNKQPQCFVGSWIDALRKVVSLCLEHHGYAAETHYIGYVPSESGNWSDSSSPQETSTDDITMPDQNLSISSPEHVDNDHVLPGTTPNGSNGVIRQKNREFAVTSKGKRQASPCVNSRPERVKRRKLIYTPS